MNRQTSFNRRNFITTALSAGLAGSLAACSRDGKRGWDETVLIQAANTPVLQGKIMQRWNA